MNHLNQAENNSFNVNLAMMYGVECAIVLGHIAFWIGINRRNKKNFRDGKTWTYQTRKNIAAAMPYFSEDQVRRFTDKLCDIGVLVKGNYNKSGMDKTIWYAFSDEKVVTKGKSANGVDESANGGDESATPIPDTKEDTEKKNNNSSSETSTEKPPPRKLAAVTPSAAAQAVVVFSCLNELNLDEETKAKHSRSMNEEKAIKLVERVKGWDGRGSDAIACNTVLKLWGTWEDLETKEDVEKKNKKWTEDNLRPLDGKKCGIYTVVVSRSCVEFLAPGAGHGNEFFNYSDKDFIKDVETFIEENRAKKRV